MKINEMVKQVHANAKEKGFWDEWELSLMDDSLRNNFIATRLALIHGEVSEALEALRIGDMENFAEELGDIMQRVADLAGGLGIDLETVTEKKMEKNKARKYKHGKSF